MSIAKVLEVMAEGPTIEAAVENAVTGAGETVRNIKSVWVQNIQAEVDDGEIDLYRVNCKITFVVD